MYRRFLPTGSQPGISARRPARAYTATRKAKPLKARPMLTSARSPTSQSIATAGPGPSSARLLLDAYTLAAVAALGLAAAVVGGIGGFGTGVILTAALAPLIGVKSVVPVLAVAGVIINAGRFWFYRQHLERSALGLMLIAALPFLVLGAWLYAMLDARTVGTILGIAVLASVPLRRLLLKRAVVLGRRGLAIGASIFGF